MPTLVGSNIFEIIITFCQTLDNMQNDSYTVV